MIMSACTRPAARTADPARLSSLLRKGRPSCAGVAYRRSDMLPVFGVVGVVDGVCGTGALVCGHSDSFKIESLIRQTEVTMPASGVA